MENIIEINNLNKSFGKVQAVDGLSFVVKEGELFAFLGVNGAGKSTTISIICGLLTKDSGSVMIDGTDASKNIESVKNKLGVVFQNSLLDKALTVRENLTNRAALYGIKGQALKDRLHELDGLLGLEELYTRPLGKLSGGQRRRVDIARALIHRPKILILDEPTTGLDPQTRKTLWDVIDDLRRQQKMTVLLTTHYMEEAADADYVVIIEKGRIAAKGTPLELKNLYTGDFVTLYGVGEEQVQKLGLEYQPVRGGYRITVPDTKTATQLIVDNPELFGDYEIVKGKMDDVFLNVTGNRGEGGVQ